MSPELTLSSAQLALAREYGFAIWARLKEKVERRSAGQRADRPSDQIIYNLLDDIETALRGLVEPTFREVVYGHAEVRLVVRSGRGQAIVGCYVRDGQVQRGAGARVIRDGQVAYNGLVAMLKRFKDDVREVNAGYECGLGLENWPDPREGDLIEAFGRERGWAPGLRVSTMPDGSVLTQACPGEREEQ